MGVFWTVTGRRTLIPYQKIGVVNDYWFRIWVSLFLNLISWLLYYTSDFHDVGNVFFLIFSSGWFFSFVILHSKYNRTQNPSFYKGFLNIGVGLEVYRSLNLNVKDVLGSWGMIF